MPGYFSPAGAAETWTVRVSTRPHPVSKVACGDGDLFPGDGVQGLVGAGLIPLDDEDDVPAAASTRLFRSTRECSASIVMTAPARLANAFSKSRTAGISLDFAFTAA